MSGTNKLVQSEVQVRNGSEKDLTAALMNANEVAAKSEGSKESVIKSTTKSVMK